MVRAKLREGPEAASMIKCSVWISPRISREKQNNNCMREKDLFCEVVDNLAQRCKQLGSVKASYIVVIMQ